MRAVSYCRYSTARQDARSLHDQRRRCAEFAASRGWTLTTGYEDAEVSGTQLQRPGLDQLRADAAKRRFDVVVVDDLSRLSRDLGAGWSLIFGEFDGLAVIVADVMTGLVSTDPAAKMTFATLGLVNMMTVEAVKHQTRRGLDSRARAGFHAGGPCYGYRTQDEPAPSDPTRPRKVLTICEPEAEVIREVFTRYAGGQSCKTIAADLNARAVPPPRTGSKRWDGWHATTTRYILRNRRYLGEMTWNARRFVKDPTSGKRRAVPRPPSEHVVTTNPDLAIVGADLFQKAQARFRGTRGGRVEGTVLKHPPSPLRGLAKCGVCGGGMMIAARRYGRGAARTLLRCTTNSNRGRDVCTNGRSVMAEKVVSYIVAEMLATTVVDDGFVDDVLARFAARRGGGTTELRQAVETARTRMKNVLDAVTSLGPQPELLARYQAERADVERLEAELKRAEASRRVPDRDMVLKAVAEIRGLRPGLSAEEMTGELRKWVSRIDLAPDGPGWSVKVRCRLGMSSGGVIVGLSDSAEVELTGYLRAA